MHSELLCEVYLVFHESTCCSSSHSLESTCLDFVWNSMDAVPCPGIFFQLIFNDFTRIASRGVVLLFWSILIQRSRLNFTRILSVYYKSRRKFKEPREVPRRKMAWPAWRHIQHRARSGSDEREVLFQQPETLYAAQRISRVTDFYEERGGGVAATFFSYSLPTLAQTPNWFQLDRRTHGTRGHNQDRQPWGYQRRRPRMNVVPKEIYGCILKYTGRIIWLRREQPKGLVALRIEFPAVQKRKKKSSFWFLGLGMSREAWGTWGNPRDLMNFTELIGLQGIPWDPWTSMKSMEFHGFHGILRISSNSMGFHALHGFPWNPWNSMELDGILWIPMELHGIPWNACNSVETMEFHGFRANQWNPCSFMEVHGNPWNPMESVQFHKINNLHSMESMEVEVEFRSSGFETMRAPEVDAHNHIAVVEIDLSKQGEI